MQKRRARYNSFLLWASSNAKLYSFHRIEKSRHQYITRAKSHSPNSNQVHFPISVKHLKLLCVGSFSTVAHRILNKLVQRFFALILTISLYLLCLRSVTCLAWEILCLFIFVPASCINSLVQVVIFLPVLGKHPDTFWRVSWAPWKGQGLPCFPASATFGGISKTLHWEVFLHSRYGYRNESFPLFPQRRNSYPLGLTQS